MLLALYFLPRNYSGVLKTLPHEQDPRQLPPIDHLAGTVNAMRLKDRFGDVRGNHSDSLHLAPPNRGALTNPTSVALAYLESRRQHAVDNRA
jgi:hypothetical protein